MFRPQIQKTRVMFLMTIIILCMVYWAVNSYERKKTYGYDIKTNTVKNTNFLIYFIKINLKLCLLSEQHQEYLYLHPDQHLLPETSQGYRYHRDLIS